MNVKQKFNLMIDQVIILIDRDNLIKHVNSAYLCKYHSRHGQPISAMPHVYDSVSPPNPLDMKLHLNYSEISQNFQRFKAAAPQAIRKAANSANLAYQLDLLI